MTKLSQFSRHVTLRDGKTCHLRAIRPDDKQGLLDGFHRLSRQSIYFRFISAKQYLTEQELKFYTEIDFEHHVALVATLTTNEKEKPIGVGRYIELKKESSERVAELAFAVDDEYQNIGVGTVLFEHIVTIAQNNGISKLIADVLMENKNMLHIFIHSDFKLEMNSKNSVTHIEFNIANQKFHRYYDE